MKALQVLESEHAAIAACCARFAAEIDAIVIRSAVDAEALDRLVRFFEQEVDGQHQEKEERVFLPRLFTRAHGADVAAVRTLLDDHATQRACLVRLRAALEDAAREDPDALAGFVRDARRYLCLQDEHSRWEQRVVFPLARRILGPRDDRAIRNGFRRLDEVWGASVIGSARALVAWLDHRDAGRRHERRAGALLAATGY